jgi:hypothetical protein
MISPVDYADDRFSGKRLADVFNIVPPVPDIPFLSFSVRFSLSRSSGMA